MELEIRLNEDTERSELSLGERVMLGVVRLASLPLFLLVIILSSLIYGIAILARLVAVFLSVGSRRVAAPARAWTQPVNAHDA